MTVVSLAVITRSVPFYAVSPHQRHPAMTCTHEVHQWPFDSPRRVATESPACSRRTAVIGSCGFNPLQKSDHIC